MSKNIFHPESGLMVTMTWITDCIFLSLFWILGCIPVVTAGASFAALYDATFRGCRKSEKHAWQRFLHVFRENWKAGILPTIVFYAVVGLLGKVLIGIWNSAVAETVSWMVFSGAALIGVTLFGILSILFPMLSRFDNRLGALLKNTVYLGLANLPRTLVLGLLNVIAVILCARFVFPLFFLPAVAALLGSFLVEPMFRPYMKDENAAE